MACRVLYPSPTVCHPPPCRINATLQVLDVCKTEMGIKGVIALCTALVDVNTTLQVFDMGHPLIHMEQDTTILNISRMLACNTSLRELGLSKHTMVDSQFESLVTYGLLRNSSLTKLNLACNKLSPFAGTRVLGVSVRG